MSETIFDADQAPVTPETPPATPAIPPEVAEFVGEGKKYRSTEDALKSIPHAQTHISKLEQELAQHKEELAKARAMEELLKEFKQGQHVETPQAPQVPAATPSDPVDIDKKVEEILSRKQAQAVAQQNVSKVLGAFQQQFGEQAKERYTKLAEEVGLPVSQLNALASSSPEAVLKLAGIKQAQPVTKPTSSVVTPNTPNGELPSARVKPGATTKDLVNAWKAAGQKIGKPV